ncbi:olee1-like protein [Euphorbia lathyris]|uniref:olee1-like protein n=1 Tax=Euphorbia lathyris TaxID=212925 RepID=UPI0033137BC1
MAPMAFFFLFFVATFLGNPFSLLAHKPHISSKISVVGLVYCDACSTKSFSKHSYFLPGVDVHIQCKFKAVSPRTAEQIDFTVNRTTDKHGIYKLEIAIIDGIDCVDSSTIESLCQATVIKSSNSSCQIPLLRSTTDQITIKSKQENHCIYSLNALSYHPRRRNDTLCTAQEHEEELGENPYSSYNSYNSSEFFLPLSPTVPPFTYPQSPPSLPFPFPPLPPAPIFRPVSPPAFNLGDPRTWVPYLSPSPPQNHNP